MLLTNESGPLDIFKKLRYKAGILEFETVDEHDLSYVQRTVTGNSFWTGLLSCPYCLSGWMAALLWALPDWVINWLAVWDIAYWLLHMDEDVE